MTKGVPQRREGTATLVDSIEADAANNTEAWHRIAQPRQIRRSRQLRHCRLEPPCELRQPVHFPAAAQPVQRADAGVYIIAKEEVYMWLYQACTSTECRSSGRAALILAMFGTRPPLGAN